MNIVVKIITLALVVAAAGCAQVQAKFNQDVQAASVPDLQAAVADAKAAGDADGLACWNDVLSYVQALPTSSESAPLPTVAGVASGIEAARIAAAAAGKGIVIPPIPHQLEKDCAIVVIDAQKLAAQLGLSAAALSKGLPVLKAAQALSAQHP